MTYNLWGKDFVEEFEEGGKRDIYYKKKFGKPMGIPRTSSGKNGCEVFVPRTNGITLDDCKRIDVCICDDEGKDARDRMSIPEAVRKVKIMIQKQEEEAKKKAEEELRIELLKGV
jgi:hypothetical protein